MKNFLTGLTVIYLLSSCSQLGDSSDKSSDSTRSSGDTNSFVIIRDSSINTANAYSDLFIDSSAIAAYITKQDLNDTMATMVRNFYTVRNNQFAWFASDGMTEQARGLWSLYANQNNQVVKDVDKSLKERMDTLLLHDSSIISATDSFFQQTELALTEQLVRHATSYPSQTINPTTIYFIVPAKKLDPLQWADSILNTQQGIAYKNNAFYQSMKEHLGVYYKVAQAGGWQPITTLAATIKKGSASPLIKAIKKRLTATNEYTANDTSEVFTDSLITAIKSYQQVNGLQPNGIISDSMIAAMNIPVAMRLQQILINMNRVMWMQPLTDSNRIQVNIPSFMLYAYEGTGKSFEMPVIVGKEGTSTVMFRGDINQIVFNPYWNIPESIVRREIQPAMKNNPNYLKKHNMEIVGKNEGLPKVRQLPGDDNALGRMKFLFPNSYDIYLHDTPDKSLFARKDRALSHGCIRVANALKLAQYLLRDQSEWDAKKINGVLNSGKEQKVSIPNPRPVLITYQTAWVDENGLLNFRNDVYGHDLHAADKMFSVRGQDTATFKKGSHSKV